MSKKNMWNEKIGEENTYMDTQYRRANKGEIEPSEGKYERRVG
jgi:hypothetical protein